MNRSVRIAFVLSALLFIRRREAGETQLVRRTVYFHPVQHAVLVADAGEVHEYIILLPLPRVAENGIRHSDLLETRLRVFAQAVG